MNLSKIINLIEPNGYIISYENDNLRIGGEGCPNIIELSTKNYSLKYALDPNNLGASIISNPELKRIWKNIENAFASGELQRLIEEEMDEGAKNLIDIYSIENGNLIKSQAKAIGYPNTTTDGTLMYNNTHFATAQEAIESGLKNLTDSISYSEQRIARITKDLKEEECCKKRLEINKKKLKEAAENL